MHSQSDMHVQFECRWAQSSVVPQCRVTMQAGRLVRHSVQMLSYAVREMQLQFQLLRLLS